eukprot:TRINITY_DN10147_c0_g2_i1.p1 TRINITY_DN10147_c0_g2~~TRINITY_DN10147_c0_g2_i1.p1  ORF type:complete len:838 (-),score=158.58 TRINITY_DN10147_c0_g2_i1:37-2550(-)
MDDSKVSFVIFGCSGVGKSSIQRAYIHCKFDDGALPPTDAIDMRSRVISMDGDQYELELWDTPGTSIGDNDAFSFDLEIIRKRSKHFGALVVFDVTNTASFVDVAPLLRYLQSLGVPTMLLANKCDADVQVVQTGSAQSLADTHNALYHECSAKALTNVNAAITSLVYQVLAHDATSIHSTTVHLPRRRPKMADSPVAVIRRPASAAAVAAEALANDVGSPGFTSPQTRPDLPPRPVAPVRSRALSSSATANLSSAPSGGGSDSTQSPVPALILSAWVGRADECKTLLGTGADVHAVSAQNGCTALHAAAASCSAQIISMLLEHGAHVNVTDTQGDTPLNYLILACAMVALHASQSTETATERQRLRTALQQRRGPDVHGYAPHTDGGTCARILLQAGAHLHARDAGALRVCEQMLDEAALCVLLDWFPSPWQTWTVTLSVRQLENCPTIVDSYIKCNCADKLPGIPSSTPHIESQTPNFNHTLCIAAAQMRPFEFAHLLINGEIELQWLQYRRLIPDRLLGTGVFPLRNLRAKRTITEVVDLVPTAGRITIEARLSSSEATHTPAALPVHLMIMSSEVEIVKRLGCGATGEVFLADYCGQQVAVKKLKPSVQDLLSGSLFDELEVLKNLRHPNIVNLLGYYLEEQQYINLVEEFAPGGELRVYLDQRSPLSVADIVQIARDVAQGLRYLHSRPKPVLHLDLKAENVLMNGRRCLLTDFGSSHVLMHTKTFMPGELGTLPWMSPQFFAEEEPRIDAKADMYSFGILLWELVTGKLPYEGTRNAWQLRGEILKGKRPPIPDGCHPEICALMTQCWQLDPMARPTASDAVARLSALSKA